MKIGTLVRGEVNGQLGIITDIMECGSAMNSVRVYWIALELPSTTWIRTFDLEVICK